MSLESVYSERYSKELLSLADRLERFIVEMLDGVEHIDRVSVRAKSIDRFLKKSDKKNNDGSSKYTDPLTQVQDQVGARIVCFYLSDVKTIEHVVQKYLRPIESKLVIPESEAEFGYFGKHYILFIPDDVLVADQHPKFFELQIKTLFQHAWSEAEHDLAYKPKGQLPPDMNRKIAFTAAQAWGADMIFDEISSNVSANDA